jgi:hypothetical protein
MDLEFANMTLAKAVDNLAYMNKYLRLKVNKAMICKEIPGIRGEWLFTLLNMTVLSGEQPDSSLFAAVGNAMEFQN